MGNISNVSRNLAIAEGLLQGSSQSELAKQYNLSQSRISRILNTDDAIRTIIQGTTKKLSLLAPTVYANYTDMLADSEDRPIQLKATQDIARIIGILPTHTSNQFILNIMQANVIAADPSALSTIMTAVSGRMAQDKALIEPDPDVVEAEYEDNSPE